MRRTNSHTQNQKFSAAPAGAVFPVVETLTVRLPSGEGMTFMACDTCDYDNHYLTTDGELVVMQAVGRDAIAIRRHGAAEQIVTRRDAANMVSATRINDLERPSLHAALTDPDFVALARSMSVDEFRVLVAEMVLTAITGERA